MRPKARLYVKIAHLQLYACKERTSSVDREIGSGAEATDQTIDI